jgi:hypothetical protein
MWLRLNLHRIVCPEVFEKFVIDLMLQIFKNENALGRFRNASI